jgi:2-polyprenyl-6-methoxyphenol hydroxylase-like FAD-dependent oxidoreductase
VFLAGDAARMIPPAGGLGGDTAIGDGYDLGRKLAAVCVGEAGPGLLDSYQAERRPAAEAALSHALSDAAQFPSLDIDPRPEPAPVAAAGRQTEVMRRPIAGWLSLMGCELT